MPLCKKTDSEPHDTNVPPGLKLLNIIDEIRLTYVSKVIGQPVISKSLF